MAKQKTPPPKRNWVVPELYRGPYKPKREHPGKGKGSYRRKPKHIKDL